MLTPAQRREIAKSQNGLIAKWSSVWCCSTRCVTPRFENVNMARRCWMSQVTLVILAITNPRSATGDSQVNEYTYVVDCSTIGSSLCSCLSFDNYMICINSSLHQTTCVMIYCLFFCGFFVTFSQNVFSNPSLTKSFWHMFYVFFSYVVRRWSQVKDRF